MSKEEDKKDLPFIKLHLCVVKHKTCVSRLVHEDGIPEIVDVTLLDKVIFLYMRGRYEYFTTKKSGKYYESYQQIAEALNIDKKSVARFVQKWKTHGYIDYFNGAGNRVNYTKIDCMFSDAYAINQQSNVEFVSEPPSYLQNIPIDNSGYVPDFNSFDYQFEQEVGLL